MKNQHNDHIRALWEQVRVTHNLQLEYVSAPSAAPTALCVYLPNYGGRRGVAAVCFDGCAVMDMDGGLVEAIVAELGDKRVSIMFFHDYTSTDNIIDALDDWGKNA